MRLLQVVRFNIFFYLILFSCNTDKENKETGYEISVQEIKTVDELYLLGKEMRDYISEEDFNLASKDIKYSKVTIKKLNDDETYIQIKEDGSNFFQTFTFLTPIGFLCQDGEYKKNRNYELLNFNYSTKMFVKLKKGTSLSTISLEGRNQRKLKSCIFFEQAIIYNNINNGFESLIYDTRSKLIYRSLKDFSSVYNFNPSIDFKEENKSIVFINQQLKSDFNSVKVNKIEMQKDTFIFLGKRKFPKNYYDNM